VHFGLTDEQNLLQNTLRRFTAEEVSAPRLRELFDEGAGFDPTIWKSAAAIGLCGLTVPERFGGADLELLDLALAFEVLGEAAVPGPFLGHALATLALCGSGSDAQKEEWLPRLASGECVGGFAFAETGERWCSSDWEMTAKDNRISGTKEFAEVGPETQLIVVSLQGGALACIDAQANGLSVEPVDGIDRTRPLSRLHFDHVAIEPLASFTTSPTADADTTSAAGACLATPAESVLDAARVLLAADAFGAAWKLIRATAEYAQTREQFGTPIAQFQAVKHQLADMAMNAETMRGLIWYAGYALDHLPHESAREAATAKAHVTEHAVQIARSAVALHGGIGFTWECDVQFYLKRTMFDRVWLGSPGWHRERIATLGNW
jgi:alkylation response protein AidB-like acyl-CoA dehydrogenase